MDVFFVTADSDPNEGRGSFSVATLAKGLRSLGHKPTVIVPGTALVDGLSVPLARRLSKAVAELGTGTESLDVRTGRTAQGLEVVALGSPEQFGGGPSAFVGDDAETARRLAMFAKAAARYVAESGAEAVHGLGVAGALTLAYLPSEDSTAVRVLSIDDALEVGRFPVELESLFGLGPDARDGDELVLLRAGIVAADATMLPSGAVGRALSGDARHPSLGAAFAARSGSAHVVLPGLDGALWNPLTDPHLPSRFDPVDRSGKARCASALCRELGLPIRAGAPLLGVELEGGESATTTAVLDAVRAALRQDTTVVVRTRRDVEALDELAERWTDRLVVLAPRDDAPLHHLLGAADLMLVARDDARSSGLLLGALRYGAVPIASREHPLADRLVDCEPSLRTGTAFLADGLDTDSVVAAVRRALSAFALGVPFELVRQRAMRVDVSLDRMARHVERLYRVARTESELRVTAG